MLTACPSFTKKARIDAAGASPPLQAASAEKFAWMLLQEGVLQLTEAPGSSCSWCITLCPIPCLLPWLCSLTFMALSTSTSISITITIILLNVVPSPSSARRHFGRWPGVAGRQRSVPIIGAPQSFAGRRAPRHTGGVCAACLAVSSAL